jgi:hypothetical protein
MWTCLSCGALYVTKSMWHSCGQFTVEEFLKGKSEKAIRLYHYFLGEYQKIGPIIIHPAKTRITFMVKVRFSGVSRLGKDYIAGGFWLREKIESPKFYRIEFIPKDNYILHFKIYEESDIDKEFRNYMKMAYAIGERKPIRPKSKNFK